MGIAASQYELAPCWALLSQQAGSGLLDGKTPGSHLGLSPAALATAAARSYLLSHPEMINAGTFSGGRARAPTAGGTLLLLLLRALTAVEPSLLPVHAAQNTQRPVPAATARCSSRYT
eukprot:Transcript_3770.p6 GENE.Transcript_3770~~Transcript_3770.p6  ORF type:complete len:118 (+),score=10.78 Transcript_3770:845-1198(+)